MLDVLGLLVDGGFCGGGGGGGREEWCEEYIDRLRKRRKH